MKLLGSTKDEAFTKLNKIPRSQSLESKQNAYN
jgi:hypothetical protein